MEILTDEQAIDRASLFFAMNGGRFITGEVEPGIDYPATLFLRSSDVHYENGVFRVHFSRLPPFSEQIDPNFAVVEVDALTGKCSYGIVM